MSETKDNKPTYEELEAENSSLKELNTQLNEQLAAEEAKEKSVRPTFKVGKETYELVIPKSKYKGQEVTAKTLKEDTDLLKKLVEIKAGCLRLKEEGGSK